MTPIEHAVLLAVRTCLTAGQRPTLARIAPMVGRTERHVARYFRKFEQQGLLAFHEAWLRTITGAGLDAISRGPTELPKGPGRPVRVSRSAFTMLRLLAYGTRDERTLKHMRTLKVMRFVQLNNVRRWLCDQGYLTGGYDEVGEAWVATEEGVRLLEHMRATKHPWWLEETSHADTHANDPDVGTPSGSDEPLP
jgi:hypothetical protein